MLVVRMYIIQTFLVTHSLVWEEFSKQVASQSGLQVQAYHIVVLVKSVLHDGCYILGSLSILSYTVEGDSVQYQSYDNDHQGYCNYQYLHALLFFLKTCQLARYTHKECATLAWL